MLHVGCRAHLVCLCIVEDVHGSVEPHRGYYAQLLQAQQGGGIACSRVGTQAVDVDLTCKGRGFKVRSCPRGFSRMVG